MEIINASYPSSKSSDDLKLVLSDLKDFIMILESVISIDGDDKDEFRMNQILNNVSQPIEKMVKNLKSNIQFSHSIQREINSTIADLASILTKILELKGNEDIKQLACRHILRLYLGRIYRISNSNLTSSQISTIPIDVSSVILTTVEAMYQIHQQKDFFRSSNNNNNNNKERANSMDDNENISTSVISTTSNIDNDFMLKGGIDLLLDLMQQIWDKLHEEIRSDIDSLQILHNSEKGLGIRSSNGFGIMLDSGVFASGILRLYTNDEINRKRMIHLGAIEIISEGFKVISTVLGSNEISKFINSSSIKTNCMDKVAQILIQLVAAMRNFSLDNLGRNQILSTKCLPILCRFLSIFKEYPELTLNCARVTAKLSLHDSFRLQINTNLVYLKSLVDVIIIEAQQCQRVMNEVTENNDISWPSWYTWPLLSRVAFTLGNLTTSNEINRKLIGTELNCIKYLLLLLWACTGSISQLQSQSQSHHLKLENDVAAQELRDGTVKLIRLLANLCMDRDIGIALAKKDTISLLLELLTCIQNAPDYEELLLNVVATSTNFTFYACQTSIINEITSSDNKKNEQISLNFVLLTNQLGKCVFHDNDEVVLEASRALGNLTRCSASLNCICKSRFIEALVLLLQHENVDIVSAITGTLVNISGNKESREVLINTANPLLALGQVLRRSSLRNLKLSTLVCQVLYNLLLINDSIVELLPSILISGLEELIDCVIEFSCDDNSGNKENKYSDFIKVGNAVMSIINSRK